MNAIRILALSLLISGAAVAGTTSDAPACCKTDKAACPATGEKSAEAKCPYMAAEKKAEAKASGACCKQGSDKAADKTEAATEPKKS